MTIANTSLQLFSAPTKVASALTGRTVRYLNQGSSSVKSDGVRTFKIECVDDVFTAKNGKRCATVLAKDVDDAGASKYRTLHLAGIAAIV